LSALLQELGVRWSDVFMAGVAVGIWWTGRNRRAAGERVGKIEDEVAEVRGILKALSHEPTAPGASRPRE
jgi:hypothetical protein